MGKRITTPRVAFIAESWGGDEETASRLRGVPTPLVGASGTLFNNFLKGIGIDRRVVTERGRVVDIEQPDNILVTNVFNRRPNRNEVRNLFIPKKVSAKDPRSAAWPPLEKGRYLDPELAHELDRLFDELTAFKPDVVITMGNAALWALTRSTGVMAHRGCWHMSGDWTGMRPAPVIPTIHPEAVLRRFTWFVLVVSDMRKAMAVARGELAPTRLNYIAEPTLHDLRCLKNLGPVVTYDIETRPSFRAISCVGLGNSDFAICVPFIDDSKPDRCYWSTPEEEYQAWLAVKEVLEDPKTVKVGQNNGSYDVPWLREVFGIELHGPHRDTRLLHHALFPELPHDLGAIATSWPDVLLPPWKADFRESKGDT